MTPPTPTALGVIEGFFGASWHWQERHELASFMASQGYNFYIYAPKNDACLRRHWRKNWPHKTVEALYSLRQAFKDQHISFGIGLSPLDLCQSLEGDGLAAFEAKIATINSLQPDILCLLFDDMRGDIPNLARIQSELTARACALTEARQVILCPTYYSDDPILEKVFGKRPTNYWQVLRQGLDEAVDVFWTGPRVCSEHYPIAHLQEVAERLGRKPILWDNYPVNDGAVKSRHLHLRAFGGDRAQLAPWLKAHAVNPMNQFHLSKPALASLPLAYQLGDNYKPDAATYALLNELCGTRLGTALMEDLITLQDSGLDKMGEPTRLALLAKYRALPESGFSRELIAWLDNQYQFDPACLTD